MTSQRAFGIALIGSAVALFLFIAIVGSHASAASSFQFRTAFLANGYQVTPSISWKEAGLNTQSQAMTIHDGDAHVRVELFDYADEVSLQDDWMTTPGSPAIARNIPGDFAGRSAFWNKNSVLVVDFRAPNDGDLARRVGDVFLSQSGDSVVPVVSSREAAETTVATVQPPHTGDADLLVKSQRALPIWAGLVWAGLSIVAVGFAGAGGLALVKAARR